jgi:hypothetical protein
MPEYLFQHPETNEVIFLVQRMNDPHVYTDDKGTVWARIFTVPQGAIDTKIDPWSSSEFVRKTAKRGMTAGEMWDLSKELSDRRIQTAGDDPVKRKVTEDYTKRTGKPHPNQ